MRLSRLKQLMYERIDDVFEDVVEKVLADVKAACPVDTGELRASITTFKKGKRTVIVGSKLLQMRYSNWGNDGNPIVPKNGKYMWFQSKKDYNLPKSKSGYYYAERINPYKGTGWLEDVAKKYGCQIYGR